MQDTCVATTATTSMATPSMTGHTSTSIHTIRALSLTPSIVAIWRILIHIWALRSASGSQRDDDGEGWGNQPRETTVTTVEFLLFPNVSECFQRSRVTRGNLWKLGMSQSWRPLLELHWRACPMNKLMTLSNSCNGNSNRFGHDIWSCHKIWNLATSCNIPRFKHKHGEDTSRCLIHQVWNIKNSKHVKTLWYNETWRLGKSPIHLVDLPTKKKHHIYRSAASYRRVFPLPFWHIFHC